MSVYFDSKDPRCKSPFGAVLCGTEVSFAVFFDPEDGILGGELQVREEFAGVTRTISLRRESSALRGTYTAPGTPELAWYSFTLRRQDAGLVWPGRQLSDLPGPLLPQPHPGPGGHGGRPKGPRELGRHAGLSAG